MKRLVCIVRGHDWLDRFYFRPPYGSTSECLRCGLRKP